MNLIPFGPTKHPLGFNIIAYPCTHIPAVYDIIGSPSPTVKTYIYDNIAFNQERYGILTSVIL